jgi:hypothetical protein
MEFKDITTWSVSKGLATPVNPYSIPEMVIGGEIEQQLAKSRARILKLKFESIKLQHTFATNAPDGSYSADRFGELIQQVEDKLGYRDITKSQYNEIVKDNSYRHFMKQKSVRQFLPFIDQVKEAEIPVNCLHAECSNCGRKVDVYPATGTFIKEAESPKFGEWISDRFVIYDEGTPLLQFESEVHIKDTQNEECTIVIKSGYSDLEPTKIIAQSILKILNNGHSSKSA